MVDVKRRFGLPRPADSGVVAMGAAAALVSWIVITHHDPAAAISRVAPVPAVLSTPAATATPSTSGNSASVAIAPVALTAERLKRMTASFTQPVFWVGAVPGVRYELSRTKDGNVFVRYLPPGVRAGQRGQFLTVGTYPFPNAYSAAEVTVRQSGVRWQRLSDGALASYRQTQPNNIYLAYPNIDYKIQLYDASPAEARQLVATGRVQPIG